MKRLTAMLMRPLITAAIHGASELSAVEKADVYEGIALIAQKAGLEDTARNANTLAQALRDAEMLQLHFKDFANQA